LLYRVDPEHIHNLWNVESPFLGAAAALLAIAVTVMLVVAFVIAVKDARRSD
jgi:energy-converting hydrogenase Eha subunit C